VNVIACIVVGILAGWIAERITGRNHGLLTNLIVGIVGAFIGSFLVSSLLGFQYAEGFNLPSILVATIGARSAAGNFGRIPQPARDVRRLFPTARLVALRAST